MTSGCLTRLDSHGRAVVVLVECRSGGTLISEERKGHSRQSACDAVKTFAYSCRTTDKLSRVVEFQPSASRVKSSR